MNLFPHLKSGNSDILLLRVIVLKGESKVLGV